MKVVDLDSKEDLLPPHLLAELLRHLPAPGRWPAELVVPPKYLKWYRDRGLEIAPSGARTIFRLDGRRITLYSFTDLPGDQLAWRMKPFRPSNLHRGWQYWRVKNVPVADQARRVFVPPPELDSPAGEVYVRLREDGMAAKMATEVASLT